ncbi:hypothetical protein IMCC3317_15380 [Kordia antarctica]|uniref:Phosphate-selective porin O and P n=1 Tax=Kordia antarctica TaxID=1218801 RepID=A0A7L4ZID4_9FLAO|nr:hypothetical protein [Kordia antarctica]QHI36179.1 hypothetical protein IMCC3317_15380 [Kordia antarctica]
MKYQKLVFILFLCLSTFTFAQSDQDSIPTFTKNGISKPSILSTNPFGIFISRLNHNFKRKASQRKELNISLESGNVWGPNVKTYIPNDPELRREMSNIAWFSRQYLVEEEQIDAEYFEIETDGVIKGLRGDFTIPIAKNQELVVGFRAFILTNGKFPFSALTTDKFIEFFHDNVAGGDDPFDRRVFGLDKAKFLYKDRNGRELNLGSGDFLTAGIETHYFYYPTFLNDKKIYFNLGAHVGTNLSEYNMSMDVGISAAGVKQFDLNDRHFILFGLGTNILRKNAIDFQDDNLDFGTNDFIGSFEANAEYSFISSGKTYHSFGLSYYMQTSLHKKDEDNYNIYVRDDDASKSWGHGTRHLYKNTNYWTLAYTFTRKISTTFYIQQDFTVNNNPDLQTGVSVKFGL